MKPIKRFAAAALAALFAFSAAGCSKKDDASSSPLDPKNPVTITVWHYYNGLQQTGFDKMVEEFNETRGRELGIVVEGHSQGSVSQLGEAVSAAAEKKVGSEKMPNIFGAYADQAYDYARMNMLVDLSQYLSDDELSGYIPSYIEEGKIGTNGELVIFPIAKSTEVFMINKTKWDEFSAACGVSEEKLSTMEGLVEVSEIYYNWTDSLTPDIKDDGKAFFGRDSMANLMILGAMQLKTEIFSVNGGKVTLNTDKEAFRRLWDTYYVPYINGYFTKNGRFSSDDMKVGDIVGYIGSSSSAGYFPEEVIEGENSSPIESWVLPVPVFENGEKYAVQQGAGMVVVKSTEAEEYASVEFLKWFTEESRNIKFSYSSGYLPVKTAANNYDMVKAAVEESGEEMPKVVDKTLKVAIKQTADYKLYTNKAFNNGGKARDVLENSLQGLCEKDRQTILDRVSAGEDKKAVVSEFTTDEHFEEWYESVCNELTVSVGSQN